MYLPLLRSKQHELLALRALAPRIGKCSKFLPLVEPVGSLRGFPRLIEAFNKANAAVALIANPRVGIHAGAQGLVRNRDFALLTANVSARIGIYLDPGTTKSVIHNAVALGQGREIVWIHRDHIAPNDRADVSALFKTHPGPHVVNDNVVDARYIKQMVPGRYVRLHDPFNVRKNASYPPSEAFGLIPGGYVTPSCIGVSDYSIVGHPFSDKGGAPHAVAIHMVRLDGPGGGLRVDHYISDQRTGTANTGQKVLEALSHLNHASAQYVGAERTLALRELQGMHASGHVTTLGKLKELGMCHHFELALSTLCP